MLTQLSCALTKYLWGVSINLLAYHFYVLTYRVLDLGRTLNGVWSKPGQVHMSLD